MPQTADTLGSLRERVRMPARTRHARWDEAVFQRHAGAPAGRLWRMLAARPAAARERSLLSYLTLVAAGIGAGHLTDNDGPPQSLLEGLLAALVEWLGATDPDSHGPLIAAVWNLADGAHREAPWMEQYLLARCAELSDPRQLAQQAAQLLRPALEPPPEATWTGAYEVSQINLAAAVPAFLPGEISMLTPSLARIRDRRQEGCVGVLLSSPGRSACIGRMDGAQACERLAPPPLEVLWGHDHVTVGGTRVALPLMAARPLHALGLPSGHLLAVVPSSQRLWLVQPA